MRDIVMVPPREAALRILGRLYGSPAEGGAARAFELAAFQEDAVRRAHAILLERGGVLIADSVGLGKTYIALALIEEQLRSRFSVLVVAPAALTAQWRMPLRRLAEEAGARTRGLGPEAPAAVRTQPSPWLGFVSQGHLSRGTQTAECLAEAGLVVVDEAHAFRNPRARRYRELARLCRGARVVLLTATPINNTLLDLYTQIRLFAGDGAFHDLGVADLRAAFRSAALQADRTSDPAVRAVLRAVMVRRTRPLLRDALPDGLRPPHRAAPATVRYDLAAAYPTIYESVAAVLDAASFPPFRVGEYAGRAGMSAVGELMRIQLLKRLESSTAAFNASIAAQVRYYESFLTHLGEGRLLSPSDHRVLRGPADADAVQLFLGELTLREIPHAVDTQALTADTAAELERLVALRRLLDGAPPARDPKLAALRKLLAGPLHDEKVLLFTEFRDTARYLWIAFRDRGGVGLIHGSGAFLGRSQAGRHEIVQRFAPLSNGVAPPPRREAIRLLIATDVLSEGMNLQDARHVVSYDLPWNPVRLVQRVGRIDRIGSPHTRVFTHAFLPDEGLERLLGLLDRVRRKLEVIRGGVGLEGTLIEDDEPSRFVERLARGDPGVLDDIERSESAPFEAEERLRLAYLRVLSDDKPGRITDEGVALGVLPGATPDEAATLLLAIAARSGIRLVLVRPDGTAQLDPPESFPLLEAALHAEGICHTPRLADDERVAARAMLRRGAAAAGRLLAAGLAAGRGPRAAAGNARRETAASAVARRLLAALARVRGGPDTELCGRIERLLSRLAEGVPAGLEEPLGLLAHHARQADATAREICQTLEVLLGDTSRVGMRHAHGTVASEASPRTRVMSDIEPAPGQPLHAEWRVIAAILAGCGSRIS